MRTAALAILASLSAAAGCGSATGNRTVDTAADVPTPEENRNAPADGRASIGGLGARSEPSARVEPTLSRLAGRAGDDPPPSVSAPPPEAQRSASGLAWIVLGPGHGARHPSPTDHVLVHYTGWRAATGERFDSSRDRGEPTRLPVGGLIPGWVEGLQLMVEGEARRFWIPAELAYGEAAVGRLSGALVYDVELVRIE